jgi:hypothetical protein
MKSRGFAPVAILIIILVVITSGIAYFIGLKNKGSRIFPTPTPTPTPSSVACTQEAKICPDGKTSVGRFGPNCEFAPCPETDTSKSAVHPDWILYKNEQYGFQIFHPQSYKVLNDKENLYGWPNAIVLLYNGGQSYDLPIEVWDTKADYETKYHDVPNLTVKEVKGKFITLLNMNTEDEVGEIINTFKVLE